MRRLKALVTAFSVLSVYGCGGAASYSDMSPSMQTKLTENLELLAVAYENFTLENGESPTSWNELERHIQDVEMEIDLQVIKDCGYSVSWGLDVEDVTGENSGQVVLAQAIGDSPKLYADGTVNAAGSP